MSETGAEEPKEQSPTPQEQEEGEQQTAAEPEEAAAEDEQQTAVEEDKETKEKEQSKEDTEAYKRQKQFVAEFNRLKESLEKEATKIIKPEFQPYTPYIHTSLAPYHNTYTVQFLLNLPPHVRHGYITRKTAIGLVDPEVSYNMDVNVDSVPASVAIPVASMPTDLSPRGHSKSSKDGSTRLPKWPVVKFQKKDDPNKRLNWGDVPRLRESLRTQYSSNAQERVKNDYERTKQDWSRMELEKLQDIHKVNRSHMKITCGTYLGTSPGSRKAIKSLTKILE